MVDIIAIKRAQKACFLPSMRIRALLACLSKKFTQFYCANVHIIFDINKRFRQKVKIATQFVKAKCQKIAVSLHPD